MSTKPIDEVVIVGRDAELWLAACVLQTALQPAGVTVTAVELPSRLSPAGVYVALPALEALHDLMRIDEAMLLGRTLGAFSLGQNFVDATGGSSRFFHAYGAYGAPIDHKPFFSHWTLARRFGLEVSLEEFSLTAAAARHGRMLVPDPATHEYGRTDYGYHLPAIRYASVLKHLAIVRGVKCHETIEVKCHLDACSGAIQYLTLSEERRVTGTFFIDASGGEAALIDAALQVPKDTWCAGFPADRRIVLSGAPFASIPAYAEVRAAPTGWLGLFPSRERMHASFVYCSQLCTDDAALRCASQVAGMPLQAASVEQREVGLRAFAWERNCVAIGAACCSFDPLHDLDLQALQMSLVHLLSLFPVSEDYVAERREFNRLVREGFERLRDYQSAHYLLNAYAGPFWERARRVHSSTQLAHKIATFRARGEVPLYEQETFPAESWQALFVGHGILPETDDPLAQTIAPETMKREFRRILRFVRDKVEEQPTHDFYLQSLCGGPAREQA